MPLKPSFGAPDLFAGLGRFVVRFRYLVLLATFLAVAFLPSLGSVSKSDNAAFLPAGTPRLRALRGGPG